MERNIVILAKSAKNTNFCLAGIDITTKEWIRPISNDPSSNDSVPLYNLYYKNGEELNVLDFIRVNFLEKQLENKIQPENLYYDEKIPFEKISLVSLEKLLNVFKFQDRKFIFYDK